MNPDQIAFWLLKNVNRAIREFGMIRDGDRVAVGLSGGKDSLTLLRLLDLRRRNVRERYELVALHVLGDSRGALEVHPPLLEWLQASGYEYALEPLLLPEGEEPPLNCQRCTWNRRRTLFTAARRLGCNVLAFGHHADDLAETTLLNLVQHGKVETIAPCRDYFDGAFRMVRPLCYLRESSIRRYARAMEFPSPPPLCPLGEKTARHAAGELLRQAEKTSPKAVDHLLRTGLQGLAVSPAPGKQPE
jgi:tRNA 2-thiocytidine biosynthesis protein TtcA